MFVTNFIDTSISLFSLAIQTLTNNDFYYLSVSDLVNEQFNQLPKLSSSITILLLGRLSLCRRVTLICAHQWALLSLLVGVCN